MRNIAKEDLKTTASSTVYNRLIKKLRTDLVEIWCSYCRYHRCENYRRRALRSWKTNRKTQHR